MSTEDRSEAVRRYIRLVNRERHGLTDEEQTELDALARELSLIRGDEALRLICRPSQLGFITAALRS